MLAGSLFSGIGGLDHGLHNAGWDHAFFCESDPWRRTVLAHHWPGTPIYEDVRDVAFPDAGRRGVYRTGGPPESEQGIGGRIGRGEAPDLLCGGFPCQDLSVAGQRRGLAGERSGLFFEFARITDLVRPRWVLIENVPGLLSSNSGRDFGIVLGTMADIGYGLGWRVLDSRYFGVPQRRRRVFILGAVADGDPRAAAERAGQILAVGTRCPGHPPTRRETREGTPEPSSNGAASSLQRSGPPGSWREDEASLVTIAAPLSHGSKPNSNMAGRRREDDVNLVPTEAQTFDWQMGGSWTEGGRSRSWMHDTPGRARSLVKNKTLAVWDPERVTGVRRLTPIECERLQALPDQWTNHGPDSRRYAALGDAVTSSVAEWIGRRILAEHRTPAWSGGNHRKERGPSDVMPSLSEHSPSQH